MNAMRASTLGTMICGSLLTSGCYWGFGAGPTLVSGRSSAKSGANSMTEVGFVFDYKRVVRVAYAGSLQFHHGALFTVDGQHVVVPLPNSVQVEVTAHRFPEEVYLRGMARAYWGSGIRVGPSGHEAVQGDSHGYGGLFGATVLFAGDDQGLGPTGLSISTGLLVASAQTPTLGHMTYFAPMLLVGYDFFPPSILYCWFVDEKCPHHLTPVKN